MLRIAICENDEIHLQMIKKEIEALMQTSYHIQEFLSAQQFWSQYFSSEKPVSAASPFDIIFMDIELENQQISGITLAQSVNQHWPMTQIIFISQYLEYAPDVYFTQHTFFVYKNRIRELLPKALEMAQRNLNRNTEAFPKLCFQTRNTQFQIPVNQILYLERVLRETYIYTYSEKYHTYDKITTLLDQLPSYFAICHRSYVVNLSAVSRMERTRIFFPDGKSIPVSRSHSSDVQHAFAQMLQTQAHSTEGPGTVPQTK